MAEFNRIEALRPRISDLISRIGPRLPGNPPVTPAPSPPAAPPAQPSTNPFDNLPMPSPGDRIKSDDFKKLSQCLRIISDTVTLCAALFGRPFGEAKQLLATQQFVVQKVMSVFGTDIDSSDSSLDARRVVQALPLKLGERNLAIVLSEAVESQRVAPNLLGLTYREASERIRTTLGDITFPLSSMPATPLVGLTLTEAAHNSRA